jgi:hypothetical protein
MCAPSYSLPEGGDPACLKTCEILGDGGDGVVWRGDEHNVGV